MPRRADEIRTNRLSVYMIRPEFQNLADIASTANNPQQIDGVGTFLFEESHTNTPGWVRGFFGDALGEDLRIFTASARCTLIVPVRHNGSIVNFAVVFGVGRFLLKDGVVEERFGLKVVLNSADEASFRSIDKTTLGSVPKHSREQMSRDVTPADFGIDIEQDLISLVTARSRDPRFGKIITGKDALYLSAKVDVSNIVEFLSYCLDRYKSNDYKTNFDWIDQIAEVRNKRTEEELDSAVLRKINGDNLDKVWMAVPEVVNWADIQGFRYLQAKRANIEEDLDMAKFIESFGGREITVDDFKNAPIFSISAQDGEVISRWSAFRCTYAEVEHRDKIYILNNGKWYEIARDFTEEVQRDYDSVSDATIDLPKYVSGDELSSYNTLAASTLANACCMDQQLIPHGGGHSKVEFCDVLTHDKKIIHVKKYGGSSVLSHLFSQGMVSGELFLGDAEFRRKLNARLPRGHKLPTPAMRPDAQEYEVVFAIISKSTNPLDMPFFSKVSLRNARKRLVNYGYIVTKKKILKTTVSRPR